MFAPSDRAVGAYTVSMRSESQAASKGAGNAVLPLDTHMAFDLKISGLNGCIRLADALKAAPNTNVRKVAVEALKKIWTAGAVVYHPYAIGKVVNLDCPEQLLVAKAVSSGTSDEADEVEKTHLLEFMEAYEWKHAQTVRKAWQNNLDFRFAFADSTDAMQAVVLQDPMVFGAYSTIVVSASDDTGWMPIEMDLGCKTQQAYAPRKAKTFRDMLANGGSEAAAVYKALSIMSSKSTCTVASNIRGGQVEMLVDSPEQLVLEWIAAGHT